LSDNVILNRKPKNLEGVSSEKMRFFAEFIPWTGLVDEEFD
jgi:hypothetical protein